MVLQPSFYNGPTLQHFWPAIAVLGQRFKVFARFLWICQDLGWTYQDFSSVGGLRQYGTNKTGDVTLSTVGGGSSATSGDSYMVLIRATKHYA